MTPQELQQALVPHQEYPIVAYYAVLVASADGSFPPPERQFLLKMMSETMVNDVYITGLERAVQHEHQVGMKIANFIMES